MSDSPNLDEIFGRAIQIADEDERRRYVEEATGGDKSLFDEVWTLCLAERRVRRNEDPLRVGELVGNYEIIRLIHSGQLATVYRASHLIIKNRAVVKVFKGVAASGEGEEVWRRDSALLSRLSHDSIVRFYDAGFIEKGHIPYVVMEYVGGSDIAEYCNSERLPCRQRLELFGKLCAIIHYVHENGVAHLDLKPSNILITSSPEGQVKLIDFGAGKLLRLKTGDNYLSQLVIAGTKEYASPEMVRLQHAFVGVSSDIYSLGSVLYKLMTGRPPLTFEGHTNEDDVRAITDERPVPPSRRVLLDESDAPARYDARADEKLSPEVVAQNRSCQPGQLAQTLRGDIDAIVMKCLEKERRNRYQTAEELRQDIDNFLSGRPVRARCGGWAYRLSKLAARRLGVGVGVFGWPKWRTPAFRVVCVTLLLGAGLAYARRPPQPYLHHQRKEAKLRVITSNDLKKPTDDDKWFQVLEQELTPRVRIDLLPIVPAGTVGVRFMMGNTPEHLGDAKEFSTEMHAHPIELRPFYLGRLEVTQAQWRAVATMPRERIELEPDPSENKEPSAPVTHVSYDDATEFCERLSRATGLKYRLPTEAEWEYACRAGQSPLPLGSQFPTYFANCLNRNEGKPLSSEISVGNAFGLLSMNGNVWEWTQDLWHDNYNEKTLTDGSAWETITFAEVDGKRQSNQNYRVIRGGSFAPKSAEYCRCESRTPGTANTGRNKQLGFRIALSADQVPTETNR